MIDTQSILFRLSSDAIFICDSEGLIFAVNESAVKQLAIPANSLVGKSVFSLIKRSGPLLKERLRSGVDLESDLALDFITSSRDLAILKTKIEIDPSKNQFLIVGSPFINMSESDHHRWTLALESTDAGFWGYDTNSNVMYFSKQFETMLGYQPGELTPNWETLVNTVHPDDRARAVEVAKALASHQEYHYRQEIRLIKKTGDFLWVLAMGARRTDESGLDSSNGWRVDIHDRKMMEIRLRSSELKSRALLESLPDIIFVHDREGRYLEAHSNIEELLLVPKEDLIGKTIAEMIPGDLGVRVVAAIKAAIEHGEKSTLEYELDLPHGHFYFEARVTPNYDQNTSLMVIRDVTASRLAQIELRETGERLRDFIDSVPASVFIMRVTPDNPGVYIFGAGQVDEMYERPIEYFIGRSVLDPGPPHIHPEDAPSAMEALGYAIETGTPVNWVGRFVLPSGRITWINTRGTTRKQPDGSIHFSAISLDVTHEKMLAEKLRLQQAAMSSSSRLTSLGEMAGGIAHEINNPLTVAHAHAARLRDLAQGQKPLDRDAIIKASEKIESVCMRISRIIAGLRSIARDGENDRFTLVPIAPIVADALSLCTEKLRHKRIDLRVGDVPDLLSIECRSVQISQVLVNLLLNAQHAVEALPNNRWIALDVADKGEFIEIRVSDSGIGIADEIREKVFDPFFTTKDVGQGTGLGLSVSASIAHSHSGALFIDTSAAHTTFVLQLPKRQERPLAR